MSRMQRCFLFLAVVILGLFFYLRIPQYRKIDTWSAYLTPQSIEWAQISRGYGTEELCYSLTQEEYSQLATLIGGISESNSSRKRADAAAFTEDRLALHQDGKLWLLHCMENGKLKLTFEDPETAAIYGCEDAGLYISHDLLYDYIVGVIEKKAS